MQEAALRNKLGKKKEKDWNFHSLKGSKEGPDLGEDSIVCASGSETGSGGVGKTTSEESNITTEAVTAQVKGRGYRSGSSSRANTLLLPCPTFQAPLSISSVGGKQGSNWM